jgi:hypothetical protein
VNTLREQTSCGGIRIVGLGDSVSQQTEVLEDSEGVSAAGPSASVVPSG